MLLFFDWDETISAADTLALIAPAEGDQLHGPPFSYYSKAYADDLAKVPSRDVKSLQEQFEHLASLDEVELASQRRIEDGGLFRDLPATSVTSRAAAVRLREGFEDAFASWLAASGVESHVISVGWSAAFIRARLARCLPPNVPLSICANEVEVEQGRCTGRLTKSLDASPKGDSGIRTGPHKLREMRRIVGQADRGPTVYVGDSSTDLPCLVEADVGIVVGANKSLRKTCDQVGLSLVPAAEWRRGEGKVLVQADDWHDVLAIVKGLQ